MTTDSLYWWEDLARAFSEVHRVLKPGGRFVIGLEAVDPTDTTWSSKFERMIIHAPEEIVVPGDISSAAYWLVAASLIEGSDILLQDVGLNATRTGIIDVLRDMGARLEIGNERESGGEALADIRVRAAHLRGVSFGGAVIPRLIDEIPVLAVAALFAEGDTVISDAAELRVKNA